MKNGLYSGIVLCVVSVFFSTPVFAQVPPDNGINGSNLFDGQDRPIPRRLLRRNPLLNLRDNIERYATEEEFEDDEDYEDYLDYLDFMAEEDARDRLTFGQRARPSRGQFSFSPYVGTGFSVYGMAFEEAQFDGPIRIGEITISPQLNTRITSNAQNFGDAYYPKISFGGEFGYGLSRKTEIYGGLSYSLAQSRSFDAFSFSGPAGLTTPSGSYGMLGSSDEIRGQFSDYHSFYIGAGARRFINPEKQLTPFVSASFGVKFVNPIDLSLSLNDKMIGNDDNAYANFFNQSTTYTLGLGAGFLYDVNDHLSIGLETGLHYSGGLSADDSGLGGGAQDLNDWSTDLSIPIMASARINFVPD